MGSHLTCSVSKASLLRIDVRMRDGAYCIEKTVLLGALRSCFIPLRRQRDANGYSKEENLSA